MIVNPEFLHYTPHAVAAGVLAMLGWLVKYIAGSIQDEWKETKTKLNTLVSITQVQAENHLNTIQENTQKTNTLLEKVVEGQAEMNGFLKGRLG